MNIERRSSPDKFSFRESLTGEAVVEGYGAVFNQKSRLITEGGKTFYEIIAPNAFDEVLSDPELNAIANRDHDDKKMLARTKSGTLSLFADDYGLKYVFTVPDTSLGNDTKVLLKRGDLSESSFKYYVKSSDISWSRDGDGILIRTVNKISKLRDVSIVIDGAFANTDVGVTERDLQECEDNLCQLEKRKQELNKYFTNLKKNFYEF